MNRLRIFTRKSFHIFFVLFLFSFLTAGAQEKSWHVRAYLNPILARSTINYQDLKDNQITSNVIERKSGVFFGAGIEVLKGIGNDLFVGGDFSFNSKGYVAFEQKFSGSQQGYSYRRDDIAFMEIKIQLEKHFLISNLNTLSFSSGLFYGKRPAIFGGASLYGNDFGPTFSFGIIRKKIFGQIIFEKGLLNIENDAQVKFKTSIIGLHLGYYI